MTSRYEEGSIILTGNRTYFQWGERFDGEGIAAVIRDIRLSYSRTIKINGRSYRPAMKRKMGIFEISTTDFFPEPGNFSVSWALCFPDRDEITVSNSG